MPKVDGDARPGRIDRIVGVGPSRVVHPRAFEESAWVLEAETAASNFDAAFAPLLDRLWPHREALAAFCAETGSAVTAHLRPYVDPGRIIYCFEDAATLRKLADLDAELHFCPDDIN